MDFLQVLDTHLRPPWIGRTNQIVNVKRLINYTRYKSYLQTTRIFYDIIKIDHIVNDVLENLQRFMNLSPFGPCVYCY
jgi:hypothetical protein